MNDNNPPQGPQTSVQTPASVGTQPASFNDNLPLSARMVSPDSMKALKAKKLAEKFELMRSRNWITERMVEQTQHHCHCTRDEALEKLLGGN